MTKNLYDAQNRLLRAKDASTTVLFYYDPLNRVAKRTINGTPTFFIYDGWNLIEERNGSGTLTSTYFHGTAVDELLMKDSSGTKVYYSPLSGVVNGEDESRRSAWTKADHQDSIGNTTHLSDTNGAVIEKYTYDIYGAPSFFDGNGNSISGTTYGNRFLFTGREYISQIGLYDYRNRVYHTGLGRFLQTDPIRFDGGDYNLYRYVFNNPVNWVDPDGLFSAAAFAAALGPLGVDLALQSFLRKECSAIIGGKSGKTGNKTGNKERCIQGCLQNKYGGYLGYIDDFGYYGIAAAAIGVTTDIATSAVEYAAGESIKTAPLAGAHAGGPMSNRMAAGKAAAKSAGRAAVGKGILAGISKFTGIGGALATGLSAGARIDCNNACANEKD